MRTDFFKLVRMHLTFLLLTEAGGDSVGLWGRIFRYVLCLSLAFTYYLCG